MVRRLKTSSERYPGPTGRVRQLHGQNEGKSKEHTTPWRTCKDDAIRSEFLELIIENRETITLEPCDLVRYAVDLGIMFGALQDGGVLLDSVDSLPFACPGERDGIPTCAGKSIY